MAGGTRCAQVNTLAGPATASMGKPENHTMRRGRPSGPSCQGGQSAMPWHHAHGHERCDRAPALGMLTVFALLMTGPASGEPDPAATGQTIARPVLLHVSFDDHPDRDAWPRADLARGRRDWLNRGGLPTEADPDGRFGQAIRWSPPRSVLGYDAARNLRAEQGTIAFWLRVGANAPREQSHLIIVYGLPQPLYFGHPFLRLDFERFDAMLDFNGARRELIRNVAALPHDVVDRWVHWAACWDARRGYYELFIDGDSLIRNRDDDRQPWLPERALDQIGIGNRVGPHQVWGLSPLEKSFDELWVFDRPLGRDEIHALRDTNRPPRDAGPPREPDTEVLLRFRRLEAGLTDPEALPELVCGARLNRVTLPFIRRARSVRADTHKVLDGKNLEFWPIYSGWTYTNGKTLLNLELDEHNGFDWVQLKGNLIGRLFADTEHERPVDLEDAPFTNWLRLPRPLHLRHVAIKRGGNGHHLDEIQFARFERVDDDPTTSRVLRVRPATAPHARTIVRYEPWDRCTLELVDGADATTSDPLHLPAGRLLHLQTPPLADDLDLGATRFDLALGAVAPGAAVHLALFDPVYEIRRLCTVEARIAPSGDGPQRLAVLIDHRDTHIRRGKRLWWVLCFDRDVRIHPATTTVSLYPVAPGSDQFVVDQTGAIKDLYNLLATGDPSQLPGDPRHTRRSLDELLTMAEDVLHADPSHALARAVVHRTGAHKSNWTAEARARHPLVPEPDDTLPADGSPRWARAGRAALQALRRHPDWWIDNRQADNGEFGSSANDDCDLVGDWTGLALIGDRDHRIRRAILRLADFVWHETLEEGVSRRTLDLTHAYEEGTSMLPRSFLLHYGDPVLFERLFGPARYFMHVLSGINAAGHRHLRSDTFGAGGLNTQPGHDQDIMSFEPVTPALYVAWYNGHREAMTAVRQYADAWLDHAQPGEGRFRRAYWGAHPVHFESDASRQGRIWGLRNGINPLLCFLYEQTSDPKYAAYLLHHWRHERTPWQIEMHRYDHMSTAWYRLLAGRGVDVAFARNYLLNPDYPLANVLQGGRYANLSRPYALRHLVSGDEAHAVEGVMDAWRFMLREGPLVTEAGLQADRVSIKGQIALCAMMLGGTPDQTRYQGYHHHAVSWEGCSDDVVRFVTKATEQSLEVRFYSYEPEAVRIGMRVWRLRPGTYRLMRCLDAFAEGDRRDLGRYDRIGLTVPSRRLFTVTLELVDPSDPPGPRADLAISALDARHDTADATLTVAVHNIGALASGPFRVSARRGDRPLGQQRFTALSAPDDLMPSLVHATFTGVEALEGVEVSVRPDASRPEITRVNNRVRW